MQVQNALYMDLTFCPMIIIQISKLLHEWGKERHRLRRKVVNTYTELPAFKFRSCVYEFPNISTHETDILCQDAVDSSRGQCPTFADSGIKQQRCLISSSLLTAQHLYTVSTLHTIGLLTVSYFIFTVIWHKLVPSSIAYILLYIFKYLMRLVNFS